MRSFARSALTISLAAAFLVGCGASQPLISAPGTMPESRTASSPYQVLYSFSGNPDGSSPEASLIDVNGVLYGTTYYGGKFRHGRRFGHGTVFSVTTNGTERVLHNFNRPHDLERDPINPIASLIDVRGALYGTTQHGGAYGQGTVFGISPNGNFHVLHSFKWFPVDRTDGSVPRASLINVRGTLYGTTEHGGAYGAYNSGGDGTVFSITPGGTEKVVHSFGSGSDGLLPLASLLDVNGTLYGTTFAGGTCTTRFANGEGTVFSVSTSGSEKVIHSFGCASDGAGPEASLINVNGTLYGTTSEGGTYAAGVGTVFSISSSGAEKVLHSFGDGSSDGWYPLASLIDVNGTLYGTTSHGGGYCYTKYFDGCGTVFSISTSGKEQVLHNFSGRPDGSEPFAALINVNGTLYGTTESGGTHGPGTIFTLTP